MPASHPVASVLAGRDVSLSADSDHNATGSARSVGGGVIQVARANSEATILHDTLVEVGQNVQVLAERDVACSRKPPLAAI